MIRMIINLYIWLLIADAVLSFFPHLRHNSVVRIIKQMADFTVKPIRRYLPPDLPFDFSPLIVIILLQLLMAIW